MNKAVRNMLLPVGIMAFMATASFGQTKPTNNTQEKNKTEFTSQPLMSETAEQAQKKIREGLIAEAKTVFAGSDQQKKEAMKKELIRIYGTEDLKAIERLEFVGSFVKDMGQFEKGICTEAFAKKLDAVAFQPVDSAIEIATRKWEKQLSPYGIDKKLVDGFYGRTVVADLEDMKKEAKRSEKEINDLAMKAFWKLKKIRGDFQDKYQQIGKSGKGDLPGLVAAFAYAMKTNNIRYRETDNFVQSLVDGFIDCKVVSDMFIQFGREEGFDLVEKTSVKEGHDRVGYLENKKIVKNVEATLLLALIEEEKYIPSVLYYEIERILMIKQAMDEVAALADKFNKQTNAGDMKSGNLQVRVGQIEVERVDTATGKTEKFTQAGLQTELKAYADTLANKPYAIMPVPLKDPKESTYEVTAGKNSWHTKRYFTIMAINDLIEWNIKQAAK